MDPSGTSSPSQAAATAAQREETIKIKVKTMQPATYELTVLPGISIAALKRDHLSVMVPDAPAERQRIIYRGRALRDDQTLREAGVSDDDTLHMVLRPANAPPLPDNPPAVPAPSSNDPNLMNPMAMLMGGGMTGGMTMSGGTLDLGRFLSGLGMGLPGVPGGQGVLLGATGTVQTNHPGGGGAFPFPFLVASPPPPLVSQRLQDQQVRLLPLLGQGRLGVLARLPLQLSSSKLLLRRRQKWVVERVEQPVHWTPHPGSTPPAWQQLLMAISRG